MRVSLRRIQREGEVVFLHEWDTGTPRGAWADLVYRYQGSYYSYESQEETLDGPFEQLEKALTDVHTEMLAATVRVWSELPTERLIELLDTRQLDEGFELEIDGEMYVLRSEMAPVTRGEAMAALQAEAARHRPYEPEKPKNLIEAWGRSFQRAKAEASEKLARAVQRLPKERVLGYLQENADWSPAAGELATAIEGRGFDPRTKRATRRRSLVRLADESQEGGRVTRR